MAKRLGKYAAKPTLSRAPSQPYLPVLTGMRVIAAYLVAFFHYNPLRDFRQEPTLKGFGGNFITEWHFGVTIFFVLSGFLICYRYYDAVEGLTWPWLRRYLLNRAARLYPLYLLLTLLTFILVELNPVRYAKIEVGFSSIWAKVWVLLLNITLLKGFFNQYKFTGIGQGWSLTVEECFYLGAPFLLLGIRRSRWALVMLPIALLLCLFGLWLTLGQLHFHGLFDDLRFTFNYTFLGRCVEFFAGMGLAIYLRPQKLTAPTRPGSWFTFAGSGLLLLGVLAMTAVSHGTISIDSALGIALNNLVLPPLICLVFYGLLVEQTWLRSLLTTKVLDVLGKSSYAFYLIHVGVINTLVRDFLAPGLFLRFIILNILAVLLCYFVEIPLYQWLKPKQ